MARNYIYSCTKCGTVPGASHTEARSNLTVKKIVFAEMGTSGRVKRARNAEWLCPACLRLDQDYNQPEGAISERVS